MYLVLADSMWSTLGAGILEGILPLLASVITVALAALVKKGIDKLGVKRSQDVDAMIDKYVGIGIGYAQQYTANKLKAGESVVGADKLGLAVKTVMGELDQSGITGVAESLIIARIESVLSDAPKALTS